MHPILSIGNAAAETGISFPTVASAVAHMQQLGVLGETTYQQAAQTIDRTAASLATVRKYIREGSLFRDNAATKLGL